MLSCLFITGFNFCLFLCIPGMVPEFLHGEMVHMPPNSSPEPNNMGPHDGGFGAAGVLPPRSMAGFPPSLQMAHQVHQEMETW